MLEHRRFTRLRPLAAAAALLLCAGSVPAADPKADSVPASDLKAVLDSARGYLLGQQRQDGSFGAVQPHLQTSLALLALLSSHQDEPDPGSVARAVDYLVRTSSPSGDLGDDEFKVESHSLTLTALLCALPRLPDSGPKTAASEAVCRGLRTTQRWQDRSSSTASRGGWKMEGLRGRGNDRRASAWALLSYQTAREYGIEVKGANLERAVQFMLGSFKETDQDDRQVGGFSVDSEGLTVALISAMGGWVLQRADPQPAKAAANLVWLRRHPASWTGPNYFYTNFFRVRTWKLSRLREDYHGCRRRLYLQIKDRQSADGAIGFPPGNAQNTIGMGPTFSTSMAILILNVGNSRLVFDEDWRVEPLFDDSAGAPP